MHGYVIPRRHDLSGFLLGRIPGRRDVLLRTLEDDEAFLDPRKLLRLRIGTRKMRAQGAFFGCVAVDQEWDRVGLQSARSRSDEETERMRADQRVLNRVAILPEVWRLVHGGDSNSTQMTFFARPQPFSADQTRRSRRKRSIGADELIARIR